MITDSEGGLISYQEYLPFGASLGEEASEERLYTGQQKDSTGIYYYGARYYDPELRRFISPDPIMNPYDPQNLNRYSYVQNNPYKYTDPTGEIAAAVVLGVAVEVTLFAIAVVSAAIFMIDSGDYASKVMAGENTAKDAFEYYAGAGIQLLGSYVKPVYSAAITTGDLIFQPEERLSDQIFNNREIRVVYPEMAEIHMGDEES